MSAERKIGQVEMECPICDKVHLVGIYEHAKISVVKDEQVEYLEVYYRCDNCDDDNTFVPSDVMDSNLLRARNAYREKHGLLTSQQIMEIRSKYGLSQLEMSNILGWGGATISRYESKHIQDQTYDKILRLVADNPLEMYQYLQKNKSCFSVIRYAQIQESIRSNMDLFGKEYLKRQELEGVYLEYSEPSDMNGFTALNIDKIEQAISMFAQQASLVYKVKLMKLLWYTDAISYLKRGCSVFGLVYMHKPMGALPIGHNEIMQLENVSFDEEYDSEFNACYRFKPCPHAPTDALTEDDMRYVDMVIQRFKRINGKEIAAYMHEEDAYKRTVDKQVISFELAKSLREF